MAWLFIDTHLPGQFRLAWLEAEHVEQHLVAGRAHRVLNALADLVGYRRDRLEGIAVVEGPGSFSSIRTGVLYANLFSRLLKKPLVRFSADQTRSLESVRDHVFSGQADSVQYVAPLYDQEPNITFPKRV